MISISVVGGTGYAGGELLRIALAHPEFEIHCITSRGEAGKPVAGAWPFLQERLDLKFSTPDVAQLAESVDIINFTNDDDM